MENQLKSRLIILTFSVAVITGASCIPEVHTWTPHDSQSPLLQTYLEE